MQRTPVFRCKEYWFCEQSSVHNLITNVDAIGKGERNPNRVVKVLHDGMK